MRSQGILLAANRALSTIIVNWNTRQLLDQCLDSLYAGTALCDMEVIVLDCASRDGSVEMIQQQYPQVKLIISQENLGFAKGNNEAIRRSQGKHILLLNPDTIVHDRAISALSRSLDKWPSVGVVGGQLLNVDGSLQDSAGVFPSLGTETPLLNRFKRRQRQNGLQAQLAANASLRPVDYVSGACLMSRREVLNTVGLLDEDYWLYTEEADFCYRVQKAGWGVATLTQARVTHIGQAASRQRYRQSMLYFYQTRVRFIAKHQGSRAATIAKWIVAIKARLWQKKTSSSPLFRACGSDLTAAQIRDAYEQLCQVMMMPLDDLLAKRWE